MVVARNVSTRYRDRQKTALRVAETISAALLARSGNYLAFFPSYNYLNQVAEFLKASELGIRILVQTPGFREADKAAFLDEFQEHPEGTLVGLAVMGGLFGEAVDLVAERLSGTLIVGPGLPKVSIEQELIRHYFDRDQSDGFAHAYLYPGMNRVMQAAGRVIRSSRDRGIIVLIDDRFTKSDYFGLLPPEWRPRCSVTSPEELSEILREFWLGSKEPQVNVE